MLFQSTLLKKDTKKIANSVECKREKKITFFLFLFVRFLRSKHDDTNRRPCLQTMKSQWMNDICFSFIIISPCLNKFIICLFRFCCTVRCHLVCTHGASKTLFLLDTFTPKPRLCVRWERQRATMRQRERVCVCV